MTAGFPPAKLSEAMARVRAAQSATPAEPSDRDRMLDVMQRFVHELRSAGLPVSMTENLDAMRAIEHIDLADREVLRAALGATLVKQHWHRPTFDTVFDVYFSLYAAGIDGDGEGSIVLPGEGAAADGGGAEGQVSAEDLAQMLMQAMADGDRDEMRRLAAMAVSQFAGMESGRPVGGTYYIYRTLRQLDLEALAESMMEQARRAQAEGDAAEDPPDALAERLAREEVDRAIADLKALVESEIRRRLVADRGVDAMARTLRKPLPEDIDFMHASRDEMLQLQRAIEPLTRALAARLAHRRRRRNRGHLDFRSTVRHSLSYGGVPAEPKFRHPRPSKPEIMVIADISGSVASFARFTLQFVYAMASQFSKVRSWVFIDGVDEVTRFFTESDDVAEAVLRVNTEADVVWVDGHSDYGHAFEAWHDRHIAEVTPKSSVIMLGDARNNYHATQAWVLREIADRARHLYWLNPEPRGYWDTGDSVISEYSRYCDGLYECRNLRQLQRFVTEIVDG